MRIGVLPDQDTQRVASRFEPLLAHLSQETGCVCRLVIPDSYDHLLQLFHTGEIDLAYFGAVTFVRASVRDGAVPLVMRDVDRSFTSYFLVRADSPAQRLEDCRGLRMAFGSKLSTSGHWMPRHFLGEKQIVPESFFSAVEYTGAHDTTAAWIRDGRADVGAVNSVVVDDLYDRDELTRQQVRVLWETPAYAGYVWAIQKDIAADVRVTIRDAFLKLHTDDLSHATILERLGARCFQPASARDYEALEKLFSRNSFHTYR